jgi:hypothetical protein
MAKKTLLDEAFDGKKLEKIQGLAGLVDGASIEMNDVLNDPHFNTEADLRKKYNTLYKAVAKLGTALGY